MTTETEPEAWVALRSEDDVRAALGGVKHPYETLMGGVIPRMFRLALAHDVIGMPYGGLITTIMFAPGALTRAEREMVAAVASTALDCHY
jgi:hypothetical protein